MSDIPLPEFREVVYQMYTDFYEEPRNIHYFRIQERLENELGVEIDSITLVDYAALAIDTGCEDAEEKDFKNKKELFEAIGTPSDYGIETY